MIVREIHAKTILSKSKVSNYSINPYIGCEYGCTYCYARFMKRYSGHKEKWGEFVDVKINAPALLKLEIKKKHVGRVWLSGVCDPYQPLEKKYELTRECLKILLRHNWPITIQTKSSLVLRDIDLIVKFKEVEVGFTITTDDEKIKNLFEPNSSTIKQRIETLEKIHSKGIVTFAMIAPILPGSKELVNLLNRKVNYVLVDRMNYHYADWVYRKHSLEYAMDEGFFSQKKVNLMNAFGNKGIICQILF
jgi:DNA repair photolyase